MREPEKGAWLRRRCVWQWGFVVPTVPVLFFGRHHWGTVEKGWVATFARTWGIAEGYVPRSGERSYDSVPPTRL